MATTLRKMAADELARRLKWTTDTSEQRFAFLLGAGCSVTSGVPASASLVRDVWLPRLRDLCAQHRRDIDAWAQEKFPQYDPANPAALYGPLMEALLPSPLERQVEMERLCAGCYPGFGYATLARLMLHKGEGGRFNVILTTNFDDMVADALYLYTEGRPLVILHESLAAYIEPTRTRPLVVKLHGDNRLSPLNTPAETGQLKESIEAHVHKLLHGRGLIIVGYGGNDLGITRMLESLPPELLPSGVYWVNAAEPGAAIRPWLEKRNAFWIERGDFDDFMLLVRDIFDLPHPDSGRFEKYRETYKILSSRIVGLPEGAPDAKALKAAVGRTDQAFKNVWAAYFEADRVKRSDPDRADAVYLQGIRQYPKSPVLLGMYALFLESVRKDHDRAEVYYRRALKADPKRVTTLTNYATFLQAVRKDPDRAEEYFRRAIEADPKDADNLCNYAGHLLSRGRSAEGHAMLERVLASSQATGTTGLFAECWFYAFAHRPPEMRAESLRNLKAVLVEGGRSPGWDLSGNIARARQDGHPDIEWLEKLADVINEKADISILDAWDKWREA